MKLRIKENATPVFKNKRPVLCAAVYLDNAELKRLEDLGVITSIMYLKWAAPMEVVQKGDETVRFVLNFPLDSSLLWKITLPTSGAKTTYSPH